MCSLISRFSSLLVFVVAKQMTHTEEGSLRSMLIASSVIFGVAAVLYKLLTGWLWWTLEAHYEGEAVGDVSAKQTRLKRLRVSALACAALFLLAFGAAATIMKVGSTVRTADGHHVNWLYMAVSESLAFGALGVIFGMFMWFDKDWQIMSLAAMWAAWPLLLGLASLDPGFNARLFLFVVALFCVLGSLALTFIASGGFGGPMINNRGGVIASVLVVLSVVAYFVYWYIGFENFGNRPHGHYDNTRWHTFLVWCLAGIAAHIVSPAVLMWCWTNSELEIKLLQRTAVLTQGDVETHGAYCAQDAVAGAPLLATSP